MCCRTFVFLNTKSDSYVYLNGPNFAEPDKILWLYINWYNHDFIDSLDNFDPISFSDFKYESNHCPIDFYDDYIKEYNNYV